MTRARTGGGRANKIDVTEHCDDEIYVSCNQEVSLKHSTCIFHASTSFKNQSVFQQWASGKKLFGNMIIFMLRTTG